MHAAGHMISGWLEGVWIGGDEITGPTQVTLTSLIYSEEFAPYRTQYNFTDTGTALQSRMVAANLEEMVRNVTFSLFSAPRFLSATSLLILVSYRTYYILTHRQKPRHRTRKYHSQQPTEHVELRTRQSSYRIRGQRFLDARWSNTGRGEPEAQRRRFLQQTVHPPPGVAKCAARPTYSA
jgi:hypothetical protein